MIMMMLNDNERQWSLQLKEAFQNCEDFDDDFHTNMTDLSLAQHAIVSHGNVTEALERIEGLQRFFGEYGIDHTPGQGLYYVTEFMKQQPGYVLHVDVSVVTQQAWLVTDSAAFQVKQALASDEQWKICICGIYYLHYCQWTTLAAIRQGLICEIECDSVGWHNFNMEFVPRLFGELFTYIPIKYQMMRAYNTNVVANLLFSLARPFMNTSQKESVKLGCQVMTGSGVRRVSEFYLQPNLEVATQRILQQVDCLLKERKQNELEFRI